MQIPAQLSVLEVSPTGNLASLSAFPLPCAEGFDGLTAEFGEIAARELELGARRTTANRKLRRLVLTRMALHCELFRPHWVQDDQRSFNRSYDFEFPPLGITAELATWYMDGSWFVALFEDREVAGRVGQIRIPVTYLGAAGEQLMRADARLMADQREHERSAPPAVGMLRNLRPEPTSRDERPGSSRGQPLP